MEVGWGGEGGMVGNIGLLASHLSHLTKSHRPQKDILPNNTSGLGLIPDKKKMEETKKTKCSGLGLITYPKPKEAVKKLKLSKKKLKLGGTLRSKNELVTLDLQRETPSTKNESVTPDLRREPLRS